MASARKPFEGTKVNSDRTKTQIRDEVQKWGGRKFTIAESEENFRAMVQFEAYDKVLDTWIMIRLDFDLPDPNEEQFQFTPRGQRRSPITATSLWRAETQRRWRCLLASIKQSFINIDTPIRSVLDEFYAGATVNGRTVKDVTYISVLKAIKSGEWKALPEE